MAAVGVGAGLLANGAVQAEGKEVFEIVKTKAEWMKQLGSARFAVLREEDTERPGSSPLNNEKRDGVFHCA